MLRKPLFFILFYHPKTTQWKMREGNVTCYAGIKEVLKELREWSEKMPKQRRGKRNLKRRY